MIIVGAGLAGLIAANYFRKQNPIIIEKQASLPDNHSALLRFRSDKVFKVAGLQSKVVKVRKKIVFGNDFMDGCNPYLANMYSYKVTGRVEDRSIWNLETEERHIAPPNFLPRLADCCNIKFNEEFSWPEDMNAPTISTIPMPILMRHLNWPDIPRCEFRPIWTYSCEIPGVNVNQTIYFPELAVPYYRASFVGSRLIIEFISDPANEFFELFKEVIDYFGISEKQYLPSLIGEVKKQPFGKMLPIDDRVRKEFMHYATNDYGIYSLGRFATWRPILLDDVVDDLQVIERMMNSNYDTRLLK